MRFEKWQALGNDYLILERDALACGLTPARARMLCAGHTGVGADGVLLLSPPEDPDHVADLRIFNPDGSEAELSGNGAREAIIYLRRRGWSDRDSFAVRTAAGTIRATITGPFACRLEMGQARLRSKDFPSGPADGLGELRIPKAPARKRANAQAGARQDPSADARVWHFRHVSIGNPQCAIGVEDKTALAALDLSVEGPAIEAHPQFPNRTNVSWYTELQAGPPARIRARIFERGVGETLASGTGATGAAVAYVLDERDRRPRSHARAARVTVVLDGGELDVEVDEELRVALTGWALPVFAGSLSEEFVAELCSA